MDGRVQEPIIQFLKNRYNVSYVDCITEVSPCRILSDDSNEKAIKLIVSKIAISLHHHRSRLIALSGHHDCAGNQSDRIRQIEQMHKGKHLLNEHFPDVDIICLWVNQDWQIEVV
jgi:hypothetical protein